MTHQKRKASSHKCKSDRNDFFVSLLNAKGNKSQVDKAMQSEARRKASQKLPTILSYPDFHFPTLLSAEQCSSEATAAFHATLINEGETVADLTAGLGIDVFAIAKKAEKVYAVELSEDVYDALRNNLRVLGLENIITLNDDCINWISNLAKGETTTLFIDPYRRDNLGQRVFSLRDSRPDIVTHLDMLLSKCDRLIVKASPMLDTTAAIADLRNHVSHVIYLGNPRECKEQIFICHPSTNPTTIFRSVTLNNLSEIISDLSWTKESPTPATCSYGDPAVGGYLCEPYPAIMKGAAFSSLCALYNVSKIAPNTHLFVSSERPSSFAGEIYEIISITPFNKKSISEIRKQHSHLNIATRNFPIKAPQLEQRIGVKSGGNEKLYGLTYQDGSRHLVLCRMLTSQKVEP